MDSTSAHDAPSTALQYLHHYKLQFQTLVSNNISHDAANWIRIAVVVCGYLLIVRPWLMRSGQKSQMKAHREAHEKARAEEEAANMARILREDLDEGEGEEEEVERIALPGLDSADEEADETSTTATNWGAGARIRQRKSTREVLLENERKLKSQEDMDDEQLEKFLEDFNKRRFEK